MAVALGRAEEFVIVAIGRQETVDEFSANLVVAPADRGPETGNDALTLRTERQHRLDGAFEHAAERALPAGMGGGDNAGIRVGKQDWPAIGRQHAEHDAGRCRHQRVGVRAVAVVAVVDDDGVGGMDLVDGGKPLGTGAEPAADTGAVLADPILVVVRAEADIQPAIDAFGNAALAGEITMCDRRSGLVAEERALHGGKRGIVLHRCLRPLL
ncbi:hypothetical protein D3C72_1691290 [compost metagenome]